MGQRSTGMRVLAVAFIAATSLNVEDAASATLGAVGSVAFAGIWTGSQEPDPSPASTILGFSNLTTLFSDGIFAGYEVASIKALELSLLGQSTEGNSVIAYYGIAPQYDGSAWKTYRDTAGNVITFDIDRDATWKRTFDLNDADVNYEQDTNSEGLFEYTGSYTLPDGSFLGGRGQLNASSSGTANLFEVTQTAVVPLPTTALGLASGLGLLGLMRRRRRRTAQI